MGVQGSAAEQLQNSYIGETCAHDDKLPTEPTADNQKMPIYDLFSKRQRVLEGKVPDVYSYDEIPQQLRVQILHILGDALGHETDDPYYDPSMGPYRHIHDVLCRELGLRRLGRDVPPNMDTAENRIRQFIGTGTTLEVLDAVEICFRVIHGLLQNQGNANALRSRVTADEAIAELNERFLWHGVGYQFESGKIVRVDSRLLHASAIKPALSLLQDKKYAGANAEFLKAFEHYRKGDTKGCLNECLKALESTLKAICKIKRWPFQATDTAKTLLEICFKNELVPAFLQSHYSALQCMLESGVPTIRNKLSGHGQGAQVRDVPPHYAAYMLHITGSTIKFLIEAEKAG